MIYVLVRGFDRQPWPKFCIMYVVNWHFWLNIGFIMHVSRLDLISCHQNNNVTIVYYVLVNIVVIIRNQQVGFGFKSFQYHSVRTESLV